MKGLMLAVSLACVVLRVSATASEKDAECETCLSALIDAKYATIQHLIADDEKEELSSACSMIVEDDLHSTCYRILNSRAFDIVNNVQDSHIRLTCMFLGQCHEKTAFQKRESEDLMFTSEMETSNEDLQLSFQSIKCTLCSTVATVARDFLQCKSHKKTALTLVKKGCTMLPGSWLKYMCKSLVDSLGLGIINIVINMVNPGQCVTFGLCPK